MSSAGAQVKALVVGGTGFVGMNVVRALVRAGHEVVATRREIDNTLFARKLGARLVVAELDDPAGLVSVLQGHEVVFFCAGHYPRYSLDLEGQVELARSQVRNAIDAARRARVQRFVLTSSVATIGPPRDGRTLSLESDPIAPEATESVYHAVKLAIEQEVLAACSSGLDCVVVCPTGLLGELDVKAGTGFIIVAIGHQKLPYYIDGRTNIIDADEMAEVHVAAALRGRTGQRYLAAGHNTTVRELMDLIADQFGVPLHSWRLPLWVAAPWATLDELRCASVQGSSRLFLAREFVDMVRHGQWVDRSHAASELALPEPAPLRSTVRKACLWYERHGYLKQRDRAQARA